MEAKKFSETLRDFLRQKNIKQKELADMLNTTPAGVNNLLSGRVKFGRKTAVAWANVLGLDTMWLMSQGDSGTPPNSLMDSSEPDTDIIFVPVLNLDVRGGLSYNNIVDVEQYTINTMPFSRRIATEGDVVVPVYGESMTPRYPSGSHILIRPLPMWREWLELGNAYVIELADWRRTIKIIRKGENDDFYKLECYNPEYDTTEIPKNIIERIFQVLAVVKREVM